MKTNSTAIYRTLLRDALRLTWQRKTLWIFGIFAAFISTGGVFDVAASGLHRIQLGGSFLHQLLDTSFVGYALVSTYIGQIKALGSFTTAAIVFFMTLLILGAIFLAVLSQTSLIHGIKSERHEHPNVFRKRAHDHIGRVFLIDLLTKIAGGILVCLTTLPMLWFYTETTTYSFLVTFVQLLIFFPGVLIISIISMLSVIHIIETEATILQALSDSWKMFTRHWLATIEFAVILFLLIAVSGFGIFAIILVLSVPYAFIYSLSLLTGSFIFFILINILFALFTLTIILALGGAIVTFQYAAWYLFYKQTEHPVHDRISLAKTFRLFGMK